MKTKTASWFILIFILSTTCKGEKKDKSFKIYHLPPNNVYKNPERVTKNGWYEVTRKDFFVVKNYNSNNEQHKVKLDSFVVNYLKKDSFLKSNRSGNWSLTFFKYGNGIDENTEHLTGTDYAIHNLFSYKKEIGSYYFNTKVGYSGSNYRISPEEIVKDKRKIVTNYFINL